MLWWLLLSHLMEEVHMLRQRRDRRVDENHRVGPQVLRAVAVVVGVTPLEGVVVVVAGQVVPRALERLALHLTGRRAAAGE